jgi:hypothetical protein
LWSLTQEIVNASIGLEKTIRKLGPRKASRMLINQCAQRMRIFNARVLRLRGVGNQRKQKLTRKTDES